MGQGLLIHEVSRSHSTTHHSWKDSSGRVPSSSQTNDTTQHPRQASMSPVGFEPTISAGERPQTYALDGTATRTGRSHTNTKFQTEVHQRAAKIYSSEFFTKCPSQYSRCSPHLTRQLTQSFRRNTPVDPNLHKHLC